MYENTKLCFRGSKMWEILIMFFSPEMESETNSLTHPSDIIAGRISFIPKMNKIYVPYSLLVLIYETKQTPAI
jgi:hypothetical protein